MAKSSTSFKSGQSGNTSGRPPDPPEYQLIKKLGREQVAEIGALIIEGKIAQLDELAQNPDTTVLKAMFASCAVKIIRSGNSDALNKLLDRIVGKVPQPMTLMKPEDDPDHAFNNAKTIVFELQDESSQG